MNKKLVSLLSAGALLVLPVVAMAQNPLAPLTIAICTIASALQVIVAVGGVVMIVWAAARFVMSGGDAGKVGEAKQAMLWAIAGLVLIGLAFVIVEVVANLFLGGQVLC